MVKKIERKYTDKIEGNVQNNAIFVVGIYVKIWKNCPLLK